MKNIKSFSKWFDKNILLLITGILIVIIPAYPKLPLADLIEGYIVRMRMEDIFVLFAFIVWGIQLARKKITLPKNPFAKWMYAYIIVGLLSSISAIYLTRTVPMERQHLLKLFLHFARRIEYFSLFFIAYASIREKKDIILLAKIALTTLIGVVIYGFGQKYFYWPAFSTMNREFSKGIRLYLGPSSRVMSTFAGHYDYAAYLMMMLTILIPTIWITTKKMLKYGLAIVAFLAYWALILTASRTSWLGYIAGITVAAVVLATFQGWWLMLRRWLFVILGSVIVMFTLGDLSERFLQLLNSPETISKFIPLETGKVEEKIFMIKDFGYTIEKWKKNLFSPVSKQPPPNSVPDSDVSQVAVSSDVPPSPIKPTLPPDVTEESEKIRKEAENKNNKNNNEGSGYTENALKYGLSVAIRLDALWPRAIEGFMKNPLLGSGYSTLVKRENYEFTQAESTDNDYLRMLGETGILGTITFLALPFLMIRYSYKYFRRSKDNTSRIISVGIMSITVAMLINAVYIDVFESSKIAYIFWMFAAVLLRSIELSEVDEKPK